MIGYLDGIIRVLADKYVVIDVAGVGYRVTIPQKMRLSLTTTGVPVKMYTHFILNPRDGSVELYGFETPEELNFFELITTISGIGPKSAQTILSKADLQQLQIAIIQGDERYMTKVAGIGPKTAQRLILELKEKMKRVDVTGGQTGDMSARNEAIDALVSLGYSEMDARDALKQVTAESAEEKVKAALRMLGKHPQ